MAPRGVKRKAERAQGLIVPGSKRQCKEVVNAIAMTDSLPETCKEMLSGMATTCLPIYAAERHSYQAQGVEMLADALAGVQKKLQDAVTEMQLKVDQEDSEKAERVAVADSAQTNLAALEQNAAGTNEAVNVGKEDLASAKENLATATAELESSEAKVVSLVASKAKVESTAASAYEPLKTSGSKGREGRKQLIAVEAVLTEIELELGLIHSLPATLQKPPEERRTFDGLVVKHVDAAIAKFLADTEQAISAAEKAKPEADDAKLAADAALTKAQEQVTASSTADDAAEAALKEGRKALKTAQQAVGNFSKESEETAKSLEKCKAALASFVDGPLKAFTELKDLAPAPEPEEPAAVVE